MAEIKIINVLVHEKLNTVKSTVSKKDKVTGEVTKAKTGRPVNAGKIVGYEIKDVDGKVKVLTTAEAYEYILFFGPKNGVIGDIKISSGKGKEYLEGVTGKSIYDSSLIKVIYDEAGKLVKPEYAHVESAKVIKIAKTPKEKAATAEANLEAKRAARLAKKGKLAVK
jgi:hypothetical protein